MIEEYSENAVKAYQRLYLKRDPDNYIVEGIDECHRRIGTLLAKNQAEAESFIFLLNNQTVRPNTPTMANIGINDDHSLAACFILGLEDSMESIIEMWETCAYVYVGGGGAGIPITNLREENASISSGGYASGPTGYTHVIQEISRRVKSGGRQRRAANLLSLWYKHPDILKLIRMKQDNPSFDSMNLSVLVDSNFMEGLMSDLKSPTQSNYFYLESPNKGVLTDTISNAAMFEEIVDQAWATGDPGLIFYERVNEDNPFPSNGDIVTSNPCGEVFGPPWTACILLHMNLKHLVIGIESSGEVIFDDNAKDVVFMAVKMLNRMIDKSAFPNEKFRERMLADRPIGLGLMGWADVLFREEIPYDSDEAINAFDYITQKITKWAWEASIYLSEREGIRVKVPNQDVKHFLEMQKRFGVPHPTAQIANSTVTVLAPTGSTAISADCSYSFEPIMGLVWTKELDGGDTWNFVNKYFEDYCTRKDIPLTQEVIKEIKENNGSIQGLDHLFPKECRKIFVTAHDIHWRDRIRMQAVGQKNITMAISSTINLPNSATSEDVKEAYLYAYRMGLKGVTVYRDGSKTSQPVNFGKKSNEEVDIELVEMMVKDMMEEGMSVQMKAANGKEINLTHLVLQMIGKYTTATIEETENTPVQERPQVVFGRTVKMKTGSGELYLTINELNGAPFEVFATISKGGRSMSAKAEAIGRLVSLCLRAGVRIEHIVKQLDGIGGDYPIFQEGKLIKSIPDAVAAVLRGYENEKKEEVAIDTGKKWDDEDADPIKSIKEMKEEIKNQERLKLAIKSSDIDIPKDERVWPDKEDEAVLPDAGSICPECGQPSFSYSSGCRGGLCMNPNCGFSNCG